MKNQIILAFVCLACLGAALYANNDERQAIVKKTDGYYMFIECKPSDSYEVIGTIKQSMLKTGASYTDRKKTFLKKLSQYYPDSDGFYYDPEVTGTYEAFVIKFK